MGMGELDLGSLGLLGVSAQISQSQFGNVDPTHSVCAVHGCPIRDVSVFVAVSPSDYAFALVSFDSIIIMYYWRHRSGFSFARPQIITLFFTASLLQTININDSLIYWLQQP